ncbi:MAG TPA: DUF4254 domain-containing protein [Acidimicrobiales bacterium]|nr:DUF4254 domain-containing protein [Acidimicrobiales bacterium]
MKVSGLPSASTILHALLHPPEMSAGNLSTDGPGEIIDPILALHRSNAEQWGREDDVRKHLGNDGLVAAAKRDIDRLNHARHAHIETIDRAILEVIEPGREAPLVTESPGMAIDRLSILVIRLASTEAGAASGGNDAGPLCARVPRLQAQLDALEEAIATLLCDLATGTRQFTAHESLKLYGPPGPERGG